MSPSDTLFQFVTFLPLPFWFLMIVLPNWKGTQRVMRSRLAVMPLLAAYAVFAIPQFPSIVAAAIDQPFGLDGWAKVLGRPEIAFVAWIHFLAFDLFVGRWIYRDSRERELSAWLTAPILTMTLLLGPLGLLLYLLLRTQFRLQAGNRT